MKKSITNILLIVLLVAGLFTLTGCNKSSKLEEVKIPLEIDYLERTVSATIGYPKDKGIKVEDTDYSKVFSNEEKNYQLDFTLTEDSTYEDNKEYYKDEEEGYEEVKFGEYTGYIVKDEYDVEGEILLEDLSDQNTYIYLSFELSAIESYVDDETVDVNSLYELEEVQTILNSIKYDKGEDTVEATKNEIAKKENDNKTKNYGEFADRDRSEGISDKDGLIFIPSFESPDETLYKAEQKNDNVGIDNYLWYIAEDKAYEASGIEVRIFPKDESFESMEEYIEDKGDMYHWSKATIAGKEYDTYTFGSDSTVPSKYSKYYSGAFMVGDKVVEFSYNMYAEVPNQELGDEFFNNIINSIEYSKDFAE